MDDDALTKALVLLHQSRSVTAAELTRIDAAIHALENLSQAAPRGVAVPASHSAAPKQRSVRVMMLELLAESDRDWSVPEVLAEYERRGTPVHGKDPDNAVRSAMGDACKARRIVRTGTGRYRSARWLEAEGGTG